MNLYTKLSVIIALLLYLPLIYKIMRRQVEQNIATFILWGMLDSVAAFSIFVQGGNWYLPGAYVIGAFSVSTALIYAKTYKWTNFETFISILVIVCVVGWAMSGPRLATILSTTAVVIAGVPQFIDALRRPHQQPLLEYVGFTFANVLSIIGGKSWTIEERLYPTACTILCGSIAIASSKKYFQNPVEGS